MVLFIYGKSRKAVMNVKSWRESDTLRKSCPRKSIAAPALFTVKKMSIGGGVVSCSIKELHQILLE